MMRTDGRRPGATPRMAAWRSFLALPFFLLSPLAGIHVEGMMRDVTHLASNIGPRVAGSAEERRAAAYLQSRFASLGYPARLQEFTLPNGRRSANVIAGHASESPRLVIGAHYDSRPQAPGADDNASGVAVLLELARRMAGKQRDLLFVAFGAEERIDQNRSHHHYGSRHFVKAAPAGLLQGLSGMICIDCVGTGAHLYVQGTRNDGGSLAWRCRYVAKQGGIAGKGGWAGPYSDHTAFAHAGVPVAYYHRSPHPLTHTPRDTPATIRPEYLRLAVLAVSPAIEAICNRP
jgi:aminopeptidase YwaD